MAFLCSEDNTAVVGINTQIMVEDAPVLLEDVNRTSKDGPSFAVQRVAMSSSDNVWTGFVNCRV